MLRGLGLVQTPVMTSHAPAPPSHGSMPTNHVSVQGPATTMYAPKVYENASQTPLSPPAAPLHTHPTPTAMTLNPMIPDDPRQFPPPQVYVPPGGNSLPVLLSSTCAPQITMRGTPVGIQSTVETAHIPPTNRHQHPISYPILPHPSYGMHTPSSSVRHSQVVGQPSRAFSPTPSNIVFPDTQAIQHIPQMQVNHLPPPSATWSHIQPVSYGSQAVQPPAYHMQANTQSHTLPHVLPDGPTGFSPVQPSYSGFTQTHQVKNVQVFSGGSECRILIEDWIRDMQYLLDAGGLPPNLSFPTIVQHLGGEARRLILNLPPPEQIPQRAFDELRADYGDMQRSLDPLADFYERSQRTEESACSYAIALEATLREVEEAQNGGQPFPDCDAKLVRQFMRGLTDEEVYVKIAPMKPRLLGFRELQVELRNLARETRRFNPQHKQKKAFSQVQVAGSKQQSGPSDRVDAGKHNSGLSELTALVKDIAINQEEQSKRLAQLESRFNPFPAPSPFRSHTGTENVSGGATVVCYRCGRPGHVARDCRTVLPDSEPTGTSGPHATVVPEGNAVAAGQSLNS